MKVDAGKNGVTIATERYASEADPNSFEIASGAGTPPGNIIFSIPGEPGKDGECGSPAKEMLRLSPEGFFVEGRPVPIDDLEEHDKEVYRVFKEWLGIAVVRHQ